MRRQQQRPSFTSAFSSKRFAVALCAAVAMILGAMSVGATMHSGGAPVDPEAPIVNQSSPTFTGANAIDKPKRKKTNPQNGFLNHQILVAPSNNKTAAQPKQTPTFLVDPSKISTEINLGPLNSSLSVSPSEIRLRVDTPVTPVGVDTKPTTETTTPDPTPTETTPDPEPAPQQEPAEEQPQSLLSEIVSSTE